MSRAARVVLIASLMLSAALALHSLLSPDGLRRRQRAQAALAGARQENAVLETRSAELRAQIEALRTRSEVQEQVVRDELGYVAPGDLVLELGTPGPTAR